jgi:sigma-B regulation protein RsbU (phosphoserine phosphatase)
MQRFFQSSGNGSSPPIEPIPTVFPSIMGADIAAVFVGKRIAGDFYDSIRVSPQRVLIGLLDVAGRREDNRQILASAQTIFRNSGPDLLAVEDVNEADAMTELTVRLNRGLIEASAGVLSCPSFLACYHERFGTLCYTNAGHTPALLRDDTGVTELGSTGLPLGLFSHATSDARIVALEQRSALLLVSRGVIACEGRNDGSLEEYGLQRVKDVLRSLPAATAENLCSSVLNAVATFSRQEPLCDDRTALALIRQS